MLGMFATQKHDAKKDAEGDDIRRHFCTKCAGPVVWWSWLVVG